MDSECLFLAPLFLQKVHLFVAQKNGNKCHVSAGDLFVGLRNNPQLPALAAGDEAIIFEK